MKRWIWLSALLSQKTMASTSATVGASAASAMILGVDIWPWLLGAFGASVVQVYRPPQNRIKAVLNSMISVLIGGIVSPAVAHADWVMNHFSAHQYNTYSVSLLLASTWPWLIPIVFTRAGEKITSTVDSFFNILDKLIERLLNSK